MPMQLSTVLDILVSVILAGEIAAAALIDARERRFPHALSVLLAATSAIFGLMHGGIRGFAWHALAAAAVMALLLATETLWRRMHGGAAGLGGGRRQVPRRAHVGRPALCACFVYLGIVFARRLRLAGATGCLAATAVRRHRVCARPARFFASVKLDRVLSARYATINA